MTPLTLVLSLLKEPGLTLKLKKCEFISEALDYRPCNPSSLSRKFGIHELLNMRLERYDERYRVKSIPEIMQRVLSHCAELCAPGATDE